MRTNFAAGQRQFLFDRAAVELGFLPLAAPIIYPTVVARSQGVSGTSNVTSHPITLPTPIVAGQFIVVVFSCDGGGTNTSVDTGASGLNWSLYGEGSNASAGGTGAIYCKIAEGGDALTINTNNAEQSSHICYLIEDGYSITGTILESTGGSDTNPPSHTPPDGLRPYLAIVTRSGDAEVRPTVAPAGYTNWTSQAASGTGGATTDTAERNVYATSEDPGAWNVASEQWVAWTLMISPVPVVIIDLKSASRVLRADIKKISGVLNAAVKEISGVSNV